ncbi:UNVERIFIED_CONTAM: putative late blight resistance proteinR1B-16 [Sesamum radiatum]|uniref:Late blight resistance proteinR1B-16 n=1 Tax=Sesamum radiatum TaxID=300843 RepID=A0AAW2PNY3_SESRA
MPVLKEAEKYFANMQIGDGSGTRLEQPNWSKGKKVELVRQDNMVGLEDEEETILKYLKEETEALDVISIIVRQFLEYGKFLLVMDDVWNVEAWNSIRVVLPNSNKMGKVLITSCDKSIGTHANVRRKPHMLRFLTVDESWKLLQLKVFGKINACDDPELEEIGKKIAGQCEGLPLAIVVIGGILLNKCSANQSTRYEWKHVSENVFLHLQNEKEQHLPDIAAFSYNILPEDMRDCFLYLGVFPENYAIPAWTLIRLWIAEGFIQRKHGQSLEETAEENLNDLINRNLVMVDKTDPIGKVKTCRMHPVIRQFCISKADEQNLFKEIKRSSVGVFGPPVLDIYKYRRLCIHFHLFAFLSAKPMSQGVRSFLCFYNQTLVLDPEYTSAIPDAFNLLSVWHSNSIKFTQFPVKVSKLIHLRYLTLSWDDLDVLPAAISELWNLQTLVIDTNSHTLKIKANIWKMIQLRHLKTRATIKLLDIAEGDGKAGENLQTLSRLSPEYCTEEVFCKARNLKSLGVCGPLARLLEAECSFGKLALLENLKLENYVVYESQFPGLPPPSSFPPNLKTLTLSTTFLDWKHMSTLGMLNTLQVLKLKDNAFTGKFWNAAGGGFLRLQFLLIARTDLVLWEVPDAAFPCLQHLVLTDCYLLGRIPATLAKSLKILDIDGVKKSVVESAGEIQNEKTLQMQGHKFKLIIGPRCEWHK